MGWETGAEVYVHLHKTTKSQIENVLEDAQDDIKAIEGLLRCYVAITPSQAFPNSDNIVSDLGREFDGLWEWLMEAKDMELRAQLLLDNIDKVEDEI